MKPAWVDREDLLRDEQGIQLRKVRLKAKHGTSYQERLEDEFQLVHGPTPSWAKIDNVKSKIKRVDFDGNQKYNTSSTDLTRGQLRVRRVLDLNAEGRDCGPIIRSVDFHPTSQVGLVGGGNGVSLFHVDGTANTKIQSVEFKNFPLRHASFSADGSEFFVSSGLSPHFYSYDMLSGETSKVRPNRIIEKETIRNLIPSPNKKIIVGLGHHGNMYLFSSRTKEVIDTLTMNGDVASVAFNADGSRMYSCGESSEVYTWDMDDRTCVDKFTDHGTVSGTNIAASGEFLACGSNAGIVNVYKIQSSDSEVPEKTVMSTAKNPEKCLMNLVTPISSVKFNSHGDILAMASKDKPNAVKLVHLPSMTVFNNFPFVNVDWGRPNSVAFSPNSGYFSIGNNKGTALLFRLDHYENY